MARIRVVIPVYNRAYAIKAALDSVLQQTLEDFEIVVVDDGSTDGSGDVVKRCIAQGAKIFLLNAAHGGAAAARNLAIEYPGDFEFVAFLDSDDLWGSEHLLRACMAFKAAPEASVYFGRVEVRDIAGMWSSERLEAHYARMRRPIVVASSALGDDFYLLRSHVCRRSFVFSEFSPQVLSAVVKRSAVNRVPWFRTDLKVLEDCEFFLKISVDGSHFIFDDQIHVTVRRFGDNLSGVPDLNLESSGERLVSALGYNKLKLSLCRAPEERRFVKRQVASSAYRVGQNFGDRFELASARAAYTESLKYQLSCSSLRGVIAASLPRPVFKFLRSQRGKGRRE